MEEGNFWIRLWKSWIKKENIKVYLSTYVIVKELKLLQIKKNYLNPQWMRQQVEQIKTRFWLSEPSRFSFGRWNNNPIYVDVYNFMENLYDLGLPMLGN
jgi:hypothetical protein